MVKEKAITRIDLKFWTPIIAMAVSMSVAFTNLGGTVRAMQDKGAKLREEVETEIDRSRMEDKSILEIVTEIRETQIIMQKDIEFIKTRL